MSLSQDILAELAEIKPGSPLAEARATRDAATRHAQGSYEILFSQQDADYYLHTTRSSSSWFDRRTGSREIRCSNW